MTLREKYKKEVIPALREEFGIKNLHAVPTIKKVTVSAGISAKQKDTKLMETAEETLRRITGQKPMRTRAKKSVAGFKIREGNEVGLMVTLRGRHMWDFLTKLTKVTFPRVRDFRGISRNQVDDQGNMSIGFSENLAFPEIRPDEVDRIHGLQVTITTTAGNREHGLKLFEGLGFPFKNE